MRPLSHCGAPLPPEENIPAKRCGSNRSWASCCSPEVGVEAGMGGWETGRQESWGGWVLERAAAGDTPPGGSASLTANHMMSQYST